MKSFLLRILKVPAQPALPPGPKDSVDCFRASRRYLGYTVMKWGMKQLSALFSLLISLAFLSGLTWGPFQQIDFMREIADEEVRVGGGGFSVEMALPDLLGLIETFAIFAFVIQLLLSGFLLKLAWEMRWYMVSDTTIRIREGLVRLKEQTMTVANIQNMKIRQGPVQRLFDIYDLEVETAGGSGGATADGSTKTENLHVGHFRGLRDPEALRRRLRAQLAKHSDAGLGYPDEARRQRQATVPAGAASSTDLSVAFRAGEHLLAEARSLRQALAEQSPSAT